MAAIKEVIFPIYQLNRSEVLYCYLFAMRYQL